MYTTVKRHLPVLLMGYDKDPFGVRLANEISRNPSTNFRPMRKVDIKTVERYRLISNDRRIVDDIEPRMNKLAAVIKQMKADATRMRPDTPRPSTQNSTNTVSTHEGINKKVSVSQTVSSQASNDGSAVFKVPKTTANKLKRSRPIVDATASDEDEDVSNKIKRSRTSISGASNKRSNLSGDCVSITDTIEENDADDYDSSPKSVKSVDRQSKSVSKERTISLVGSREDLPTRAEPRKNLDHRRESLILRSVPPKVFRRMYLNSAKPSTNGRASGSRRGSKVLRGCKSADAKIYEVSADMHRKPTSRYVSKSPAVSLNPKSIKLSSSSRRKEMGQTKLSRSESSRSSRSSSSYNTEYDSDEYASTENYDEDDDDEVDRSQQVETPVPSIHSPYDELTSPKSLRSGHEDSRLFDNNNTQHEVDRVDSSVLLMTPCASHDRTQSPEPHPGESSSGREPVCLRTPSIRPDDKLGSRYYLQSPIKVPAPKVNVKWQPKTPVLKKSGFHSAGKILVYDDEAYRADADEEDNNDAFSAIYGGRSPSCRNGSRSRSPEPVEGSRNTFLAQIISSPSEMVFASSKRNMIEEKVSVSDEKFIDDDELDRDLDLLFDRPTKDTEPLADDRGPNVIKSPPQSESKNEQQQQQQHEETKNLDEDQSGQQDRQPKREKTKGKTKQGRDPIPEYVEMTKGEFRRLVTKIEALCCIHPKLFKAKRYRLPCDISPIELRRLSRDMERFVEVYKRSRTIRMYAAYTTFGVQLVLGKWWGFDMKGFMRYFTSNFDKVQTLSYQIADVQTPPILHPHLPAVQRTTILGNGDEKKMSSSQLYSELFKLVSTQLLMYVLMTNFMSNEMMATVDGLFSRFSSGGGLASFFGFPNGSANQSKEQSSGSRREGSDMAPKLSEYISNDIVADDDHEIYLPGQGAKNPTRSSKFQFTDDGAEYSSEDEETYEDEDVVLVGRENPSSDKRQPEDPSIVKGSASERCSVKPGDASPFQWMPQRSAPL